MYCQGDRILAECTGCGDCESYSRQGALYHFTKVDFFYFNFGCLVLPDSENIWFCLVKLSKD